MSRLDRAIAVEPAARPSAAVIESGSRRAGSLVPWMAMAALLTLVTIGVVSVARTRGPVAETAVAGGEDAGEAAVLPFDDGAAAALAAVGQQHFERSKLVLLGLANKDAQASGTDWIYERDLASRLLVDTRLYRLAAEERGLGRLAGIMRDLELVLLQTAMTEGADPDALSQIQRAIRRRDLLQKMDMVRTTTGI
jgi:hypothetical protein